MRFLEVDNSCESCGWIAAIVSMIAFGSYGVPIKTQAMRAIDPDPLVFQTYMTTMVFATSWVILLLPGAPEIILTPWGLVSALFWIPGGLAVIYAVQNAGLAVAIGVGNSFIVLVSFTWGIFIFGEKLQSELWACIAVVIMICGICGMSYYSSSNSSTCKSALPPAAKQYAVLDQQEEETTNGFEYDDDYIEEEEEASNDDSFIENGEASNGYHQVSLQQGDESGDDNVVMKVSNMESLEIEGVEKQAPTTTCCGVTLSPQVLGILAAVFQGAWGGSIMVPMHFAGDQADGMGFVVSFGIGSAIVTLILWILRYAYNVGYYYGSCSMAYRELPPFHFRTMALPASMSGILWSIGNLFSMVSVQYLGEGVGYSVIQLGMMVSGLWGICLFQEITGATQICKWFASATFAVGGILFLSYEHHAAANR